MTGAHGGEKEDGLEKVDKGSGSFEEFRRSCCGYQQGGMCLDSMERQTWTKAGLMLPLFFSKPLSHQGTPAMSK